MKDVSPTRVQAWLRCSFETVNTISPPIPNAYPTIVLTLAIVMRKVEKPQ